MLVSNKTILTGLQPEYNPKIKWPSSCKTIIEKEKRMVIKRK
jgi:hypothetical protein